MTEEGREGLPPLSPLLNKELCPSEDPESPLSSSTYSFFCSIYGLPT